MPLRSILKPKQVTKSEVSEAPVDSTLPSRSRIAFIELNDGRRIGLSRSYESNKNLLTSSYGMTEESATQFALDINRVFHSGAK